MKKFFENIIVFAVFSMFATTVSADVNLPKVTIAGQEYYIYEAKKGDSLYGISNKYGWNVDQLMSMNPTLSAKLSKGSKVYFPVDNSAENVANTPALFTSESYPVIQHLVKKGDSVYSIALMYDVPVDKIYTYNPDTKYGLKRGSVVTIPQTPADINNGSSYFFYAIRPGDTLGSIAETYNTTVEQLLRDNKGVSNNNFEAGDLLRVSVNSKKDAIMTRTVEETKMDHVESYIADKDDTWESVAKKTGTDVAELRDLNRGVELKKNTHVDVPVILTSQVEQVVEYEDERENSIGGINEIYKGVHNLGVDSLSGDVVSVALLIEDPQSKLDNEFTRGALLAIDRLKNSPYKIRFKVLQDRRQDMDSVKNVQALLDSLESFGAELVVATYEKNFPLWLAEYGEDKGVEVVNSFDVRSELYIKNPSIIQLLTPSVYFSDAVGEWENSAFADYKLIMAGTKDADDAFAAAIVNKSGSAPGVAAIDDIPEMKVEDWGKYLIYGYPTSRDEVSSLVSAVAELKAANPLATIRVIGRPNWITFAEDLKENFAKSDVYFPSRFFFDHTSDDGKEFISAYSEVFGHGPLRAYPTYAASGYDIMNYFIESLASNDGDFNEAVPEIKELQTPINLQRVGNWGGLFNPSAYIIRYTPLGDIEKILIRK